MKEKQILKAIENLAMSQGFYGRLLRDIKSLPKEDYKKYIEELEDQNFKDEVDMVLYLEQ
jgi:hypothetical protein